MELTCGSPSAAGISCDRPAGHLGAHHAATANGDQVTWWTAYDPRYRTPSPDTPTHP